MNESKRWLLPDGVDELLPAQAERLEVARRAVLDLFTSSAFQPIQPPLIEFTDSLLIGLGDDVAAQSMRLTDPLSGRPMALRADVSSQAARIDGHSMHAEGVNRLCYIEPVVHVSPRSQWASRCPLMAGAEIFGGENIEYDIEVILLMVSVLREAEAAILGSGESEQLKLTLDLGHVGISRAIFKKLRQENCPEQAIDAIQDCLQRKSKPDLEELLRGLELAPAMVELLAELPDLCGGTDVLQRAKVLNSEYDLLIDDAIDALESVVLTVARCFPDIDFYCDISEARGYDYHTGLVFAVYCGEFGTALANGGRYDGVGRAFGRDRPATGFNTDLKALRRLFESVRPSSQIPNVGAKGHSQTGPIAVPIAYLSSQTTKALMTQDLEGLWIEINRLRQNREVVTFVETSEIKKYPRCLQSIDGSWRVVELEEV